MNILKPREVFLLAAVAALLLLAVFGPPLAQPADYIHYAERRSWLGIPYALDVLSNLPFALAGAWGLVLLLRSALTGAPRQLAALYFAGLIVTSVASAWFHWQPNLSTLATDRLGMTLAFAGVLGLGAAGHVSARAGLSLAVLVLVGGLLAMGVWSATGNLLPWALLQGGGMVLLLVLAFTPPLPGALPVRWGRLIAIYALAKLFEHADHVVYAYSGELISGHSVKHMVAALAAWPVMAAVRS